MPSTDFFGDVSDFLVDQMSGVVAYVETRLTVALRMMAQESGWPTQVAQLLRVRHRNNSFDPSWPEAIHKHVMTFEYGTGDLEPNPVLRRFRNRAGDMADQAARQYLGRSS